MAPSAGDRVALAVATMFGIGNLPRAPGSWASAAALPVAWMVVTGAGSLALLACAAILFIVGTWAAAAHARVTGLHDSPRVVVDEVVAQWLTVAVVPPSLAAYLAGFILFRIADIAKPWPANAIDRRGSGGLSVMLDDVAAAVYAGAALYILHYFVLAPDAP